MIKIVVCGCAGNMGKEVVKAINKEKDLKLVGAVDILDEGEDVGEIAGIGKLQVYISSDLEKTIQSKKPDVFVDFTAPSVVMKNLRIAIKNKLNCVVGTTGFDAQMLNEIKKLSVKSKVGVIICPNFAVGAVLMMKFSEIAARHFNSVEVIELHHDRKKDAPSGTAIKTVEMIDKEIKPERQKIHKGEIEKVKNVRGGEYKGIKIHSVRLPGLVAHQEVIFGGLGQTLTIRHDSISRESFMPGVIMAIRKVVKTKGLIYGLENLL